MITREHFIERVGCEPENDDLNRCNCSQAGDVGHYCCGWNDEKDLPVFMVGQHKNYSSQILSSIIRKLVTEYVEKGIQVETIGNGWCDDFAREVLRRWVGEDWIVQDGKGFDYIEAGNFITWTEDCWPIDWDWPLLEKHWNIFPPKDVSIDKMTKLAKSNPSHLWIILNGKHYDAESPNGEDSFFDLMFFKRWLNYIQEQQNL